MKALLFDFSRVLLFPRDEADPLTLNKKHQQLSADNPDYPFFEHFVLNEELLDLIHQLKDRLPAYIFTSGYIQEAPALQSHLKDFKKIYSAARLGLNKKDPAAYTRVAKDIGLPPEEILFVDDGEANVAAAKEAGLKTILYTDNKLILSIVGKST